MNIEIVDPVTMRPGAGSLKPAHRYLLAVDIGPLRRTEILAVWDGAVAGSAAAPAVDGWWLDVALSSKTATRDG